MLIEDRFEVRAPRERVWSTLRDPAMVMTCVPGCRRVESKDERNYTAEIEISVGPIKARFHLDVEVLEECPPERVTTRVRGEEGTRASQLKADNNMQLVAMEPNRTEVLYSSDINITGRLGRFGLGMMQKTSSRLMQKFQRDFTALLESSQEN